MRGPGGKSIGAAATRARRSGSALQLRHLQSRVRYWGMAAVAGVPLLLWYFHEVKDNPPCCHFDSTLPAVDAVDIARHGTDMNDAHFPLYFEVPGEFRSPVHIYLLALLFRIFGVSEGLQRSVMPTVILLTAAVLGWLAFSITRWRPAGWIVFGLALITPWLFEIGRLHTEAPLTALGAAVTLLLVHRLTVTGRWTWLAGVGLGAVAVLVFYTYSPGRLLGPGLLAAATLFFARRPTWRTFAAGWVVMALLGILPAALFSIHHPGSLSGRFDQLTWVHGGMSPGDFLSQFFHHLGKNLDPRANFLDGDQNVRHHVRSMGSLLIGVGLLAPLGLAVGLLRSGQRRWWGFVFVSLALAVLPMTLTVDDFHTPRGIAEPVVLLVLVVPAIMLLRERRLWSTALVGACLAGALAQAVVFQFAFFRHGKNAGRVYVYDATIGQAFDTALKLGKRPIYMVKGAPIATAQWFEILRGLPLSTTVYYGDFAPPRGSTTISFEPPTPGSRLVAQYDLLYVYVSSGRQKP